MTTTNFKQKRYRNKRILELAKDQACTHCGIQDGTITAAHMNGLAAGKGMGMKAHDYLVAYLCYKCHRRYDGVLGGMGCSRLLDEDFYRAMQKTQAIWIPILLPEKK